MHPSIDFFYVEAGGGHKAAANALKAVIDAQGNGWQPRLVNLNHALAPIDYFKRYSGRGMDDYYNLLLKNGWTLGAKQMMKPMHWVIGAFHKTEVETLAEFWRQQPPDLVVSLIPHFNRALWAAARRVNPNAPMVTIITDFADIPPRVWLERQKQYVICGTERAVEQAYSFGHPPDRVFQVSGMILRPSFYEVPFVDRSVERGKLGLDPSLPTGVVLFGGEGANAMIDIAQRLDASGLPLQLILMHGRNDQLGEKLRGLGLRMPHHVQGFTTNVAHYMQVADFMIGKPGPGSISEALAMKLPAIVDCNAWTMPQERYNAAWLEEKRLGLVVKSWREIVQAVRSLLEPGVLEQYRERAAAVKNRAVFEIPPILEEVLRRGP